MYSQKFKEDKQIIEITHNQKNYKLQTDLIGKIQLKNLFMAMLAAKKSNLKFDKIVTLALRVKSGSGRFEKIGALKNKSKVILDYAHTPDALNTCLSNLKEQFENKRIFIVFGCGGNRDKDKRPMMGKIDNQYCDRVYLTDDNPRDENPQKIRLAIKKTINKSKIFEFSNRSKAIHKAIFDLNTGDILVIAGKGHEQTQDYGKFVNKFSDRLEILQNIKLKKTITGGTKVNESDGYCASLPFYFSNNSDKKIKEIIRTVANGKISEQFAMAKLKIIDLADKGDKDPVNSFLRKNIKNKYFKNVIENIKKVKKIKSKPHNFVVKKFGKACSYPGTFNGAIHAIITSKNFKTAVIKTIKAGGCNCSRANFVGAYFAAYKGIRGIPLYWIKKTNHAKNILKYIA